MISVALAATASGSTAQDFATNSGASRSRLFLYVPRRTRREYRAATLESLAALDRIYLHHVVLDGAYHERQSGHQQAVFILVINLRVLMYHTQPTHHFLLHFLFTYFDSHDCVPISFNTKFLSILY